MKRPEVIKGRVSRVYGYDLKFKKSGRLVQILSSCLRKIDKTVIAIWSPFKESLNIFVLLFKKHSVYKRSYFANILAPFCSQMEQNGRDSVLTNLSYR